MALRVRRVVTRHDADGRASVKIDEVSKHSAADEGLRKVGTTLKNGTIFPVIEFAPGLAARNHRGTIEAGGKLLSAVG